MAVIIMLTMVSLLPDTTPSDTTGIWERASRLSLVKIYPNPTQERLFVEAPESLPAGPVEAVIFDAAGKQLWRGRMQSTGDGRYSVEVGFLPDGMYFFRLSNSQAVPFAVVR